MVGIATADPAPFYLRLAEFLDELPLDERGLGVAKERDDAERLAVIADIAAQFGDLADDAGLAPGDVILEVNRHSVEGADTFVSQVHAVPNGKDILLLVWSHGGATYRVVHPDGSGTDTGM